MRLKKHEIGQRINGNLHLEYQKQELTSYSGVEFFRQYFRVIGFHFRVRRAFRSHELKGDYSSVDLILCLIVLWLCGGRRLSDLDFLQTDPLVRRFCGLKRLPSDITLSRWLKRFTYHSLQALVGLNYDLILEQFEGLNFSRITLDFDGTVVGCGAQVDMAKRGYNPKRRHQKSYYPFLAHIAQTGHFLQVENRSGNTHDSKGGALEVIQNCVQKIRAHLPKAQMEARFDAAFFNQDIVEYLEQNHILFAMKVPMIAKMGFKEMIRARKRWKQVGRNLWCFKKRIWVVRWKRYVEFYIFRQKDSPNAVQKAFQLDLFNPDDGTYTYNILCSNMKLNPKNLLEFYNGRCSMEKNIGELKGQFGFDAVPTNHFNANSAHQMISILAYNLVRNYQMDLGLTKKRSKTRKRTSIFSYQSLKTIRFKQISVAGRILDTKVGKTLRITPNPKVVGIYQKTKATLERLAA